MFVSKEQVKATTGYDVDAQTLAQAQIMIESYVGKVEQEVTNASDLMLLGRATAFQAAYILGTPQVAFEQAAVKSIANGDVSTTFDTDRFSPFMSPWAVRVCGRVSWMRSRSVRTGPVFDMARPVPSWETN